LQIFLSDEVFESDFKENEFLYHIWFLVTFYAEIKIYLFSKDFIWMGVVKNLTDFEGYNWRRFPYLWKSQRRDFNNPFDKGVVGNLKELWSSFVNKEISLGEKINMRVSVNENLNQTCTSANTNSNSVINLDEDTTTILDVKNMDINENNKINLNKKDTSFLKNNNPELYRFLELSKPFEPFITSDNKAIYIQYTGDREEVVNWTKLRIYTIFDIKYCPFKDFLVKQVQHS